MATENSKKNGKGRSVSKGRSTARTIVTAMVLPSKEEDKEKVLFALLLDMDPDVQKMPEAITSLHVKTGLSEVTLGKYASKFSWRIRWMDHWDRKNKSVTVQEVENSLKALMDRKNTTDQTGVSYSHIAGSLKDFSYLILATNKDMVSAASLMIQMYTAKAKAIQSRWEKKGGDLSTISKTDQGLIETYMNKAKAFYKIVEDWMKPQAVLGMLDAAGMKDAMSINPEGVEASEFTTAAFMRRLEEMSAVDGGRLRSPIGDLDLISQSRQTALLELGDLPEVDGTLVRDEENRINLDRPK